MSLLLLAILAQAQITNATPSSRAPGLVVRPIGMLTPQLECTVTGYLAGKPCEIVTIQGHRTQGWSSTSEFGDLAEYLDTSQARLNPVSTETPYYLRSSSAVDGDVDGGAGARTVEIVYLRDGGVPGVGVWPINPDGGSTALGSGYAGFQWAEINAIGSATTTGTAVGNVTISSVVGAPTVAQIVEFIAAGGNRSLSARYTVPFGWTCYGLDWDLTASGGATQDTRLHANVSSATHTISDSAPHFQDKAFVTSGVGPGDIELHGIKYPAGVQIKISSIPSSATAVQSRLDGSFHLLCLRDAP